MARWGSSGRAGPRPPPGLVSRPCAPPEQNPAPRSLTSRTKSLFGTSQAPPCAPTEQISVAGVDRAGQRRVDAGRLDAADGAESSRAWRDASGVMRSAAAGARRAGAAGMVWRVGRPWPAGSQRDFSGRAWCGGDGAASGLVSGAAWPGLGSGPVRRRWRVGDGVVGASRSWPGGRSGLAGPGCVV